MSNNFSQDHFSVCIFEMGVVVHLTDNRLPRNNASRQTTGTGFAGR
jgi:hypothetical protein